jgi:hypothetical protein
LLDQDVEATDVGFRFVQLRLHAADLVVAASTWDAASARCASASMGSSVGHDLAGLHVLAFSMRTSRTLPVILADTSPCGARRT